MQEFTGFVRPNVSPRLFTACTFLMFIVMGKCYYVFFARFFFLEKVLVNVMYTIVSEYRL